MTKAQVDKHGEVIKWFCTDDNADKGVWCYDMHGWNIDDKPSWSENLAYVQNDQYAELRMAQADGKVIEYNHATNQWNDIASLDRALLYCGKLENYRIKPDEPKFKADYETDSRLYRVWHNMRSRCSNPNTPYYLHYGGRGISVCDEWQNSFKSFELWAIDSNYKEHLEVDRINNDGNYEPSNCRLITHSENLKNRGDGISNKFSEDELSEMLEAIDRGIYPSVISKSLGNISIATLYRMKEEYLT